MSIEAFNRLVKLTARAFYDDLPTKTENQPKTGRSDNRGIAVVVLDALTRRQWVREEDLAKDLKLHAKQLRRMLRFFEEEKLVTRDHRKETAKGARIFSAAVAATADGHPHTKEGEEKIKLHTHSYCCLDYAQASQKNLFQTYDVVRYRVHRIRKKLKDELEDKNTIQEYVCPNCGKRYNALDALQLISMEDEYFHCESCNGELVADSDKIASQEVGDGDSNARRQRREKIREMLQNLEVQLKPLIEQINRVKDLPPPEFGTLQAWEARAHAHRRAENGESSGDPSKSSNGAYGGTPMPFLGDTKVEVDFIKEGKDNDVKSESDTTGQKVLPPWMIKQGMNLTKEQRGEVNHEAKMYGTVVAPEYADDEKANAEDNGKVFQDEYLKAYWTAITKRREEEEAAAAAKSRQVGMKSKRDPNEAHEAEEIWEEAPVAPAGDANGNYKVNDLNVEADATAEEDDDIDWEEG